jgi:DNA-binding NtrC family response regulator
MSDRILIVDDEDIVVRSCRRILETPQREIATASNGFDALRKVEESAFDIVILDIMMSRMDGLQVLQQLKERHPEIDVIMITGLSQIQTAVRAMKLGAFDYLPKPFEPDDLRQVVERALERRRQAGQQADPPEDAQAPLHFDNIIGSSPAMQAVYRLIAKCAPTHSTVLITGESGTGKEMIAQAIHFNSLRKDHPFVTVDCNTLSENLLESELFGHVKGAFTGAVANKRGMFEVANEGTLFLDEFGNIPLTTQAKLLRVIQEREFRPVGSTTAQTTNVRLLAATNRDLKAMVAAGTFREDLYYRINVFPIHAPALRDRREDIPALAYHFLNRVCKELDRPVPEISEAAMSALKTHDWPGNVRELENVMQRAVILCTDNVIRHGNLAGIVDAAAPPDLLVPRTSEDLKLAKKLAREKSVEQIEKAFILETLRRNGSNVTRSAEETGMQRTNFQALMKKYGIRVRDTGAHADDDEEDDRGARA